MARSIEHRQQRQSERAKELFEREKERNASFMSALGVDLTAGPIKIAPRPTGN